MKYHMSGTKSSNNSKAYFERIVFLNRKTGCASLQG
uniref:Uncharacterized protein n=1 Tax=Anguilla anguilla TaxID=7936 RepID=A0A0E9UAH8_ANGAN